MTEPSTPAPKRIDRRRFLSASAIVGGAAVIGIGASGLLSACADQSSTSGDVMSLSKDLGGNQLVGLFNYTGNYLVTERPQRLPFTIATPEGPPARTGPATLTVQLHEGDRAMGDPIVLTRHDDGTPIGYYPLLTTFTVPGTWSVTTELDGVEVRQSFLVQRPSQVPILQPGSLMATVDTPTITDARGIDPICTRAPNCQFHNETLTDALASGSPVALLISTPQFCQTGVCGPVLDLLIEQQANFPQVRTIHAEVYVDPNAGRDPASNGLAPVVEDYGLSFEPSLFLAYPNGTIATRLDNIFDRGDLRDGLRLITA